MGKLKKIKKKIKKLPENVTLPHIKNSLKVEKKFPESAKKLPEKLIIATSTLPEDDKIVQFCMDNNVDYFRGDSIQNDFTKFQN